ncbi:MAG: aminomethyl-transferring glycine dehydrogenase subunit GcvPA [Candidatus Methylomirabilales bacterium]
MRYIPNTDADRQTMLEAIGVGSVEDLFADIPETLRLKRPHAVPSAQSEPDLLTHLRGLAEQNAHVDSYRSFLGAGAYHHIVPAAVAHLAFRGEFYTAYTPYQPEISQGTLQAIYEYQTLVCQLTGMEIANASLYEGGSALAEAVLMALRVTDRKRVLLSRAVHPEYRQVVQTYGRCLGLDLVEIPVGSDGATDSGALATSVTDATACVAIQSPNFFGVIEDLGPVEEVIHRQGGLLIAAVAEPVSLGILKPPGAFDADIVVGEGQAFGNALNYGGPYLGFFATRERFLRNMPGRIVGVTVDGEGRRGFVLTLSTREQHIRREKATSNICTNEGLCALLATITLSLLGRQGTRELAVLNLRKAAYAKERLAAIPGCRLAFTGPTFNEFVLDLGGRDVEGVCRALERRKILAGLPLGRLYPELKRGLLICTTERNTRADIQALADGLEQIR